MFICITTLRVCIEKHNLYVPYMFLKTSSKSFSINNDFILTL